jgi:hypothetical protein
MLNVILLSVVMAFGAIAMTLSLGRHSIGRPLFQPCQDVCRSDGFRSKGMERKLKCYSVSNTVTLYSLLEISVIPTLYKSFIPIALFPSAWPSSLNAWET